MVILLFLNRTKAGDKTSELLADNGYKTYYNIGYRNIYDKNGNCYDNTFTEKIECKRITHQSHGADIEIFNKENSDYQINASVIFDDNYDISLIIFSASLSNIEARLEHEVMYDYTRKIKEYLYYDGGTNTCLVVIKTNVDEGDYEKSGKLEQKELDKFKKSYIDELKKIGISEKDLLAYIRWYSEQYIIRQLKLINKDLSYAEIKDLIEEAGFSPKKVRQNYMTLTNKSKYQILGFDIEDNEVENIYYYNTSYPKYVLIYNSESKTYFGMNGDDDSTTCTYAIESDLELLTKMVLSGYCSENDKKNIGDLKYSYDMVLGTSIAITQDELIKFAQEYMAE